MDLDLIDDLNRWGIEEGFTTLEDVLAEYAAEVTGEPLPRKPPEITASQRIALELAQQHQPKPIPMKPPKPRQEPPSTGQAVGSKRSETVRDFPRKFTADDLTPVLRQYAREAIARWSPRDHWANQFMMSLQQWQGQYRDAQLAGALNVLRAELRQREQSKAAQATVPTLPDVPAGRYCVPTEDGHLGFYHVDRPTEGKWAGRTFVKVQAGPNVHPLRGPAVASVLRKIALDPIAAKIRYGHELGVCGECGLPLTNEASRAVGIGPICASKLGL